MALFVRAIAGLEEKVLFYGVASYSTHERESREIINVEQTWRPFEDVRTMNCLLVLT